MPWLAGQGALLGPWGALGQALAGRPGGPFGALGSQDFGMVLVFRINWGALDSKPKFGFEYRFRFNEWGPLVFKKCSFLGALYTGLLLPGDNSPGLSAP